MPTTPWHHIPILARSIRFPDFPLDIQREILKQCSPNSLIKLDSLSSLTHDLLQSETIWRASRIRIGLPAPPTGSTASWQLVWTEKRMIYFIFGSRCQLCKSVIDDNPTFFKFCLVLGKRLCDAPCYSKWLSESSEVCRILNEEQLLHYNHSRHRGSLEFARRQYSEWIVAFPYGSQWRLYSMRDLEEADKEAMAAREDDYVASTGDMHHRTLYRYTKVALVPGGRMEHLQKKIAARATYRKIVLETQAALDLWYQSYSREIGHMHEYNFSQFPGIARGYQIWCVKQALDLQYVQDWIWSYISSLEHITTIGFRDIAYRVHRDMGKIQARQDTRPTTATCTLCTDGRQYDPYGLLRHMKAKHPDIDRKFIGRNYFDTSGRTSRWPCVICVTPKLYDHKGFKEHLLVKHNIDSAYERSVDPYDY
ncbi:hypothetical protein C8J56DRAFT_518026 [Mycena floridula]|nr:hypothetical protein C8J56DRAFT_518026 [Mycena floridula]